MIRSILGAALLTVGVVATASAQGAADKAEQIYTAQKCSLCHSIAGKGNVKGPLDSVGSKLSTDEIRAWLVDTKTMTAKTKAERKPEMKVYTLPKGEVDALVAWLSTLKKK